MRRSCTAKLSVEETDAVFPNRIEEVKPSETRLMSVAALPIVTLAAGANQLDPAGALLYRLRISFDWSELASPFVTR